MSFSDLRFPRSFNILVSVWKTTELDVFNSRNSQTLVILYIVMDGGNMNRDKALNIMGFPNARRIDAHVGKPDKIREVLDKALFDRTQQMMHGTASIKKPKYFFYTKFFVNAHNIFNILLLG